MIFHFADELVPLRDRVLAFSFLGLVRTLLARNLNCLKLRGLYPGPRNQYRWWRSCDFDNCCLCNLYSLKNLRKLCRIQVFLSVRTEFFLITRLVHFNRSPISSLVCQALTVWTRIVVYKSWKTVRPSSVFFRDLPGALIFDITINVLLLASGIIPLLFIALKKGLNLRFGSFDRSEPFRKARLSSAVSYRKTFCSSQTCCCELNRGAATWSQLSRPLRQICASGFEFWNSSFLVSNLN